MEQTRKRNKAMLAAGLLLVLVLVTTSIVCGMLARFVVTDSGKDLSRVAKFEVTGSGFTGTVNLNVKMKPGDTKELNNVITVINSSEVAVRYTVTIQNMTKNLPLSIREGTNAAESLDNAYEFSGELAANGAGSGANLSFSLIWPTAQNDYQLSGQLDTIAVTVTATQID